MADPDSTEIEETNLSDIAEMSDKSQLLAALSDVKVPEANVWPALGWMLVALFIIALAMLVSKYRAAKQKRAADAWRREALKELSRLRQALPSANDVERHDLVRQSSALLRRVMMHVDGRTNTAALTDSAWLAALHEHSNEHSKARALNEELQPLLTQVPYESVPNDQASKKNVRALLRWMSQYIDHLPKSSPRL